MTDDELTDYAGLVTWIHEKLKEGFRSILVVDHTARVIAAVKANFEEETWTVCFDKESFTLRFSIWPSKIPARSTC